MLALDGYEGRLYGVSGVTGTLAAPIGSGEIFQFRWVDPTAPNSRTLRILRVELSVIGDTTGFAAGDVIADMAVARGWTAAGTGGATLTMTTNNAKYRTSQLTSLLALANGGEIRVASTAVLGAGTKTLDAQAINTILNPVTATADTLNLSGVLFQDGGARQGRPLVVAHQEGFVVRLTTPITGTAKAAVNVVWAEVTG